MKILITGGAGFIGSNFIHFILEKYPDYDVVNLDKLTYAGNLNNLKDADKNKNYRFIRGDICDKETVEKACKDADVLVNFAAETHVDRSIIDAGSFVSTDILGTYHLLEAARKYNIEKYIQISTDEVYGSIQKGSFLETDRLLPSSPYSASKAGGDMLVHSYFVTHRLPVVVTRSSNNFGPYQYPEKLIPLFITNALRNKKLPLYGDGKNIRDWLYVLDNCDAIDLVMHKGKEGEIYNIGSGNEITKIEITRLILQELHMPESLIEFVADRKGHDRRYSLDAAKVRALGWKPAHDFNTALRETIKWYMENESWWEPLI